MICRSEPSTAEIETNLQASSTKTSPATDIQASKDPSTVTISEDPSKHSLHEEQLDRQIILVEEDRHSEGKINGGGRHRLRSILLKDGGCVDSNCEKGLKTEEPLYVEFTPDDPRNPANFLKKKKWAITAVACLGTVIVSAASTSYNLGFPSMMRDLNCTQFEATAGLSLYAFGFAIVPLVTAAFSEEFGRLPLYLASSVGFALMYVAIALAKDIRVVLIARFLQGSFGSTGAVMVGGSIADVWSAKERGLPMSIFSLCAMGSAALGPVFSGWMEMNPHLRWKWIQWIQLIVACVYTLLLTVVMKETRSSILLTQIARKLRKETGDSRYRARVEDERASLSRLIWVSCTRPVYLMTTEPVVISFSLWIGFAWGIFFCLIESIGAVFGSLHGFNIGQTGTMFLSVFIGCFLGFVTNFYQEVLYQRNVSRRGPEARLYAACFATVLFPVGMFIYGCSAVPNVPWIALAIGITIFMWATFLIYVVVFSYLADCYGPYASSALAGQSLARNLLATVFPLFTMQMYNNLGYKRANILFGIIAVIMLPIPFILYFHGPAIRRYSKFSRSVMEAEQEKMEPSTST